MTRVISVAIVKQDAEASSLQCLDSNAHSFLPDAGPALELQECRILILRDN